ncbi:putative quinol monooxygenase [Saccharopolyspora mangrovi]|uniref:Quinol monooxygenase n=1 Tax=Saccharopolyspora mangrovi TaxID=3082379 RepID=A0ABU6ALH0_9PSEU|nr:putative quinol monooxygenase [Saccharopolyspora sp. S2-29]MEB3372381.1 putative quinol monooxygenase [Saccharopolyspora sp. S2-29]
MSQEVVVTAVFHPVPGQRAALGAVLESVIPDVHEEAGCLLYALHEAGGDTLVLIEKWESRELLAAHQRADAVARLNAEAAELLQSPPEVVTMSALPCGHQTKGQL